MFGKMVEKALIEVIDDLEKRFLAQLYENNNMPLEINRDLDQDLESLLAMVFESEVIDKQKDL